VNKSKINGEYFKVHFKNDMGDKLCYYFSESELEIDKQFYRDKLLSKLGI
jgi:hypothetical protein